MLKKLWIKTEGSLIEGSARWDGMEYEEIVSIALEAERVGLDSAWALRPLSRERGRCLEALLLGLFLQLPRDPVQVCARWRAKL